MSFATRMRQARKEKKLTQQELGELCGLTSVTISNIEQERTRPYDTQMAAIMQALDKDANYFFREELDIIEEGATAEELILLSKFRKLDERAKRNVLLILDSEYQNVNRLEDEAMKKTISFDKSVVLPAAARAGQGLEVTVKEGVSVDQLQAAIDMISREEDGEE